MAYVKLLQKADQQSKDVVSGYLRELQNVINPHHATPFHIQCCCLQFYLLTEYFTKYGDNMTLNQAMDTITTKSGISKCHNTAYGNILIDPDDDKIKEYRWDFTINGSVICCYVGIDSSDKKYANDRFTRNKPDRSGFYAFRCDGYFDYKGDGKFKAAHYGPLLQQGCRSGDIISMIVNVRSGILRYYCNGKDLGNAPTWILLNRKYYMAIEINRIGTSIQLIDFQTK